MSRFIFNLDDPQRAALEIYRANNGYRSLAAALCALIDEQAVGTTEDAPSPRPAPARKPSAAKAKPIPLDRLEKSGAVFRASSLLPLGPTRPTPGDRLKKR